MRWLQWQRTLAYRASGQEEQSATELLDEDIFPSDRLAPSLVPSDHAMGCPTPAAILQVRIDIITVQASAALPYAPVEPGRLPYASIGVMVR